MHGGRSGGSWRRLKAGVRPAGGGLHVGERGGVPTARAASATTLAEMEGGPDSQRGVGHLHQASSGRSKSVFS